MNVCIISYDEYTNIPYVKKYERILAQNNIAFDYILWNRTGQGTQVSELARQSFIFEYETHASRTSKIIPFIKWRRFSKDVLRNGRYDALIICTTLPGVLLSDVLTKGYRGKYLLDIRDYTYENVLIYRLIAEKNQKNAGIVVISSEGFLKWLPEWMKPVIAHNIPLYTVAKSNRPFFSERTLTIGYVGGVRYHKVNREIISQFANHSRYKLLYVGKHHPGDSLPAYCENNGITNVEFCPRYLDAQKPDIYENIDLINSIYGAESEETRSLLPTRLYDCILYKKPILISKDTYLETVVAEYNLGLAIDIKSDNLPEKVEEYVSSFDTEKFLDGCKKFLDEVLMADEVFSQSIDVFFKSLGVS